jgi:transposase
LCSPTSIASGPEKKGGDQAIGRSRGRLTTKIHALVDALGNPVALSLTPGQPSDLSRAEPPLEDVERQAFLPDKAYDADRLMRTLEQRGIKPVIRPRSTGSSNAVAISHSITNVIWLNGSSTRSSISEPSQRATTNSREISSPPYISSALSSCLTDDTP